MYDSAHEALKPQSGNVTSEQFSIRVDQALYSDQFPQSQRSAVATTTSFRIMAVSATLGGFLALTN